MSDFEPLAKLFAASGDAQTAAVIRAYAEGHAPPKPEAEAEAEADPTPTDPAVAEGKALLEKMRAQTTEWHEGGKA